MELRNGKVVTRFNVRDGKRDGTVPRDNDIMDVSVPNTNARGRDGHCMGNVPSVVVGDGYADRRNANIGTLSTVESDCHATVSYPSPQHRTNCGTWSDSSPVVYGSDSNVIIHYLSPQHSTASF